MKYVAKVVATIILIFIPTAGHADEFASLRTFKSKALAKFSTEELARGHGLNAVRLGLEAVQAAEHGSAGEKMAVLALATALSETDEFAEFTALDFGIELLRPPWGMSLPGARYYVAVGNDGERSVLLLIDQETGRILDRTTTDYVVSSITTSSVWARQLLVTGGAGLNGATLFQIEGDRLEDPRLLDFGAGHSDSFAEYYLDEHGTTAFRLGFDHTIKALDLATGVVSDSPRQPVRMGPATGPRENRRTIAVSAEIDGALDIFADMIAQGDETLLVWQDTSGELIDLSTGETRPYAPELDGGQLAPGRVVFSEDGTELFGWDERKGFSGIWRIPSGEQIASIPSTDQKAGGVEGPIAFGSDGRNVLTATNSRILTRDARDGHLVGWYLYDIDPSKGLPDFELSYGGDVMVLESSNSIRFLRMGFETMPDTSAVAASGAWIVSARRHPGGSVLRQHTQAGDFEERFDLAIRRVLTGPGGVVAAISQDGRFFLWPTGLDGRREELSLPSPFGSNDDLGVPTPILIGESFVAIGGTTGACGLWSLDTGERISDFSHAGCSVKALQLGPNGNQLAVIGYNGDVSIYNVEDGIFLAHFRIKMPFSDTSNPSVSSVVFSQDGTRLSIYGNRPWKAELDISSADIVLTDLPEPMFSAVGNPMGYLSYNGVVESLSGRAVNLELDESVSTLERRIFSPDGQKIAGVLVARNSRGAPNLGIWDSTTGALLLSYPLSSFQPDAELDVAFSSDGTRVIVAQAYGGNVSFPASTEVLLEEAMSRFGGFAPDQRCVWFLCDN